MKERKHSIFSASGSERWLNCPASAMHCKDLPSLPTTLAAITGTEAHDCLDKWLNLYKITGDIKLLPPGLKKKPFYGALKIAMAYIRKRWNEENEDLQTESKVYLKHIHPDMFGTTDITINGLTTLKVYDYKNGRGHVVKAEKKGAHGMRLLNTQLMFYLIGKARELGFSSFQKGEIAIIQPNVSSKDPVPAVVSKQEILKYEEFFKKGVDRCLSKNAKFFAGEWCYFCPGKFSCPAQEKIKVSKDAGYFDDEYAT